MFLNPLDEKSAKFRLMHRRGSSHAKRQASACTSFIPWSGRARHVLDPKAGRPPRINRAGAQWRLGAAVTSTANGPTNRREQPGFDHSRRLGTRVIGLLNVRWINLYIDFFPLSYLSHLTKQNFVASLFKRK
jgi:hypothetical protein